MKRPDSARQVAQRFYASRAAAWLDLLAAGLEPNAGAWPVEIPLGLPSEPAALSKLGAVQEWAQAWKAWSGPAEVVWVERRWRALGAQTLPERLLVHSADDMAALGNAQARWEQAKDRQAQILSRFPALAGKVGGFYDSLLLDYAESDFARMLGVLAWVLENPAAECFPRELPVPGIDSKWLDSKARRRILTALLRPLQAGTARDEEMPDGLDADDEFHWRCGLKTPPRLLRMRVLDPELRRKLGGLCDISAPAEELAALDLPASRVLVVENLQTGLALPDMAGTVVFMKLGYAVDVLDTIPWVVAAEHQLLWGDLDTHGFGILARARTHLPRLQSVLMDEATLLAHENLWAVEPQPCQSTLEGLTEAERDVYNGLRLERWGANVRLEQERVGWAWALERLESRES